MSTYLTEKAIQDLTNDRRQIHPYPELAYEEHQTHAFIVNRLKSYGYEAIQTLGETGIVTILQGSKTEPVLLLRADMDALPITEETDVPFISEHPGKMHACGHDTHVAMLLAVARYFKEHEKELRGTLKFVFQPAEEGGLGARKMVEQGVLEQPQVDACLALHVWSSIPTGKIGLKSGPLMASVDRFDLQIQGRSERAHV
jgi:amidohydrolase